MSESKLFKQETVIYTNHPRFAKVRMAVFVTGEESEAASVCLLDIDAGAEIPVHTHDPQVDSIFVVSGRGEAYVQGEWQAVAAGDYLYVPPGEEHGIRTGDSPLKLFVHHSPPLL